MCRQYEPSILMQQMLISGEDHRFFSHGGFDLIAILRACRNRFFYGKKEGASTIEMQLIRVLTGRYERTITRKIKEIALSTLLTQVVPKKTISALYLSVGYFGWRMNGLEQACKRLGLDPQNVNPSDTAKLIARLKYPQPRNLVQNREMQIKRRAEHIFALHVEHRFGRIYFGLTEKVHHAAV